MTPWANIKGANKETKKNVGRSTALHNCFALIHYALNCLTNTFYWLIPQCGVNNYGEFKNNNHNDKGYCNVA